MFLKKTIIIIIALVGFQFIGYTQTKSKGADTLKLSGFSGKESITYSNPSAIMDFLNKKSYPIKSLYVLVDKKKNVIAVEKNIAEIKDIIKGDKVKEILICVKCYAINNFIVNKYGFEDAVFIELF